MIGFLSAHGFDPGPTQRPVLAGVVTGAIGAVPAAAIFVLSRAFDVLAADILRAPYAVTAIVLALAFIASGAFYGYLFRRGANDRRGGWLFGLTFGFAMWIAAPIVILPLVGRPVVAAGTPALGFFLAFVVWGLCTGVLFPYVHKPLHADLDGVSNRLLEKLGPGAAAHKGTQLPGPPA